MKSQLLVPFSFESKSIRVLSIDGEPWFVAKDICDALDIRNARDAISKLDNDEYLSVGLTDAQLLDKKARELNVVSESGMYTLVLRCRDAVKQGSLPHRFRKWVTAEVLPSIRKTGGYVKPQTRQFTATAEQLTPLRQTAERLITTGVANIYPDIWKLVHQRFDVQHINQLLPEQVSEAVTYLNAIEGEFLGKAEEQISSVEIDYPMSWWKKHCKVFEARGFYDQKWEQPADIPVWLLYGDPTESPSPLTEFVMKLERAGYDVAALRFEIGAHRHYMQIMVNRMIDMNKMTQNYVTPTCKLW